MSESSDWEVDKLVEASRKEAGLEMPHAGDLAIWRSNLQKQAEAFDGLGNHFKRKAAEFREKVRAADILLGKEPAALQPAGGNGLRAHARAADSSDSSFTPVDLYWLPIIETLIELGGRGPREEVIERVGKKLEPILTRADWELVPSGSDVRWRNRVAWQRLNLVKRGLLRDDSPRGIWEITAEGRTWFAQTDRQLAMLTIHRRIAAMCKQSDSNCESKVAAAKIPGHFRLKVASGSTVLISPDFDVSYTDVEKKSDDELWDYLEAISNRRVRRPVA